MSISLQTYAAGDQDYIGKMNTNVAILEAAINGLQLAQSGASGQWSIGTFLDGLFGGQTTLFGTTAYQPTPSGSNLTIGIGTVYRASSQTVVSNVSFVLDFSGQPANTYYIVPDATGTPTSSTSPTDALYSVVWTGAAFGTITRVANALFTASEEQNARISTALGASYASLDARLEAGEQLAVAGSALSIPLSYLDTDDTLAANSDTKVASQQATKAYVDGQIGGSAIPMSYLDTDDTLAANSDTKVASQQATKAYVDGQIGGSAIPISYLDTDDTLAADSDTKIPSQQAVKAYVDTTVIAAVTPPVRVVGLTIDGGGSVPSTGIKGAIQVDFAGTIIGWSIIADQPGTISVEVDVARDSPPASPPAPPPIPNTTTDKISASAPIELDDPSGVQSASGGSSEVASWNTDIQQWDVIQFNVAAVTTLTRATMYLRIQTV